VSILLAEKPATPSNIRRIDKNTVIAGDVRIGWTIPTDEGGDPVLGYKLYLNNSLWYDASQESTLNNYTFIGLSVGKTYNF
jgi:hypothetical protein